MEQANRTENLTLAIDSDLYAMLQEKAQALGKTTTELIEQGIRLLLASSHVVESPTPEQIKTEGSDAELNPHNILSERILPERQLEEKMQARFALLGKQIEDRVNSLLESSVETLVKKRLDREGFSQFKQDLAAIQLSVGDRRKSTETSPEIQSPATSAAYLGPTIRQLQVGDFVQIRDPDSPHYMEKVRLVKVSLIRATVQTDTGEHTLLKRDLRFVQSDRDSHNSEVT
jgi:hypothetical protein